MDIYALPRERIKETLKSLGSVAELAEFLGYRVGKFRRIAYSVDRLYTEFSIPKRRGGRRKILAPVDELAEVQKRLLYAFEQLAQPMDCVHGFRRGYSHITNAREHVGQKWILNVDLLDFFGFVKFKRVLAMLKSHPYRLDHDVAVIMTQLCSFAGSLPQGAPTSPILSNMLAGKLDGVLRSLAKDNRCRYTRYADDLTFSTHRSVFPLALAKRQDGEVILGPDLLDAIQSCGFEVNPQKLKLSRYSERLEVTGIVANKRVNVAREFVRSLRGAMNAWAKHGDEGAAAVFCEKFDEKNRAGSVVLFQKHVLGKLRYLSGVKGVADPVYVRLVQYGRQEIDALYSSEHFHELPILDDSLVVVQDHDGLVGQGTGFYLSKVGWVSCAHATSETNELFPWHSPHKKILADRKYVHEDHDVAIMEGPAPRFTLLAGSTTSLETGTRVYFLGFPKWSGGGVSRTDARIQGLHPDRFGARRFVLDKTVFPGHSGGPVLNEANEVIGVITHGAYAGDGVSENTFLPIEYVTKPQGGSEQRDSKEEAPEIDLSDAPRTYRSHSSWFRAFRDRSRNGDLL